MLCELVRASPRPEGRLALVRSRRQGAAEIRDPRPYPVIFLENEMLYGQSFEVPQDKDWIVPIGKAKVVKTGSPGHESPPSRAWSAWRLRPPELLKKEGIDAEVIDLRTIRPARHRGPSSIRSKRPTGW